MLDSLAALEASLARLEEKVDAMEKSKAIERAAAHCKAAGVKSEILGCFEENMCKSLVMENTAYSSSGGEDARPPRESRYYLVVVQYAAKLNADKLRRAIQRLAAGGGESGKTDGGGASSSLPPASRYSFQLASSEDNDRLTGYSHNAVTPFGLKTPLPVVLAEAILDVRPRFIWMGAGHVHCKLGCTLEEFIRAHDPIIANVSEPRDSGEEES